MSEITIVTGLPRSGTSLMMQIIDASSMEVYSDGKRERDVNNPQGYYELEAVMGIAQDNSFLDDAVGKAIKIVAPIITFCKKDLNYRVIFMRRNIDEILMSQEKMLDKDQGSEREKYRTIYEFHLKKTYKFLEEQKIPFLEVEYGSLVDDSENEIKKITEFLSLEEKLEDLVHVVKPELHRNKSNEGIG